MTDGELLLGVSGQEWCDVSNFPGADCSRFPRVRPHSQVTLSPHLITRHLHCLHPSQVLRKEEHEEVHNVYNPRPRLSGSRNQEQIIETQMGANVVESNIHLHFKVKNVY